MTKKSFILTQDTLKMVRNTSQQCSLCQDKYGLITRQHICKRCYRSVCQECGDYKVRVFRADKKFRNHRLCNICRIESEVLNRYIEISKLKIFQDSNQSQLWIKKIGTHRIGHKSKRSAIYTEQIDSNFWKSLNFSFRQFLGIAIVQSGETVESYIQKFSLLISRIAQIQTVGCLQNVIYLAAFLSCHCSQINIIHIINSWSQLVMKRPILKQNILRYLRLQLKQQQLSKIQEYLQYRFRKLQHNIGINIMTSQVSLMVVNNVLTCWSVEEYEMAVSAYLYSNRALITNTNNFDLLNTQIMKSSKYNQIDQCINFYRKKQVQVHKMSSIQSTSFPSKRLIQNLQQNIQSQLKTKPEVLKTNNWQLLRKQNQELRQKEAEYIRLIQKLKSQVIQTKKSHCGSKREQAEQQMTQQQQQKMEDEVSILRQSLLVKNMKIDQYKKQIEELKYDLAQCREQITAGPNRRLSIENNKEKKNYIEYVQYEEQLQRFKKQMQKAAQEKQAVSRMNRILLDKLNELSKKVVDVESIKMDYNNQKYLKEVGKINIDQINSPNDTTGEECILF